MEDAMNFKNRNFTNLIKNMYCHNTTQDESTTDHMGATNLTSMSQTIKYPYTDRSCYAKQYLFKRNGSNSRDTSSSRANGIKALKENFKAKIDKAFFMNTENVFSQNNQ